MSDDQTKAVQASHTINFRRKQRMQVIVVDKHDGEGRFPTFCMGEIVHNLQPSEYVHWMSCTINGIDTFVPDIFVNDNRLVREYNPNELVAYKDETLEIDEIVYEWLYGKNDQGVHGWIPAEKVISVSLK